MRIGMTMAMPVVGQRFPLPTQMDGANLVLWLRADREVTLSSASVNAVTSWALTNLTRATGQSDPDGGTNAVRLTDSADGAPAAHQASGTVTNAQSGPLLGRIWAKAGTLDQIQIQIGAAATTAVFFTFSTGLFSGAVNCTGRVVQTAAGGWFLLEVSAGAAAFTPTLIVYTAVGGTASYTGAGTGTVFLYSPSVVQDRVSQWNDQSGNGNNATQATAGNQPLVKCYDAAGNWVPYEQGGACEIGWPLNAAKYMTLAAGFKAHFVGDGKPMTVIELRRILSVPTANTTGGLHLTSPGNGTQILNNYNTPARLHVIHTDDTPAAKSGTSTSVYTTGSYQLLAFTYDGNAGRIYQNGVADASNPIDLDVGIETPSAANLYAHNSMRKDYSVWKSVLSDVDLRRASNGMLVRNGMPPI